VSKQPRIEMNEGINPELGRRKELTDLEFLVEMLNSIEGRKTQILAGIKQSQDILKILEIDRKHTASLYKRELIRIGKERKR